MKESDICHTRRPICYFAEKRKQKVNNFDILQMIYNNVFQYLESRIIFSPGDGSVKGLSIGLRFPEPFLFGLQHP